jgi:hypothetical protein
MIVFSLYADLTARGVKLSIATTPEPTASPELPPLRLRIRAPEGALTEPMRALIAEHRDDLVQFVFELEEAAAILAVMQGNRIEESEQLARECVRGAQAGPNGRLYLRGLAEHHPGVQALCEVFNGEIVDVWRAGDESARAA